MNKKSEVTGKTCPGCGVYKPRGQYPRNSSKSNGMASRCKECKAEESRAYYRKNKEAKNAASARYYRENKEAMNAATARWYRENSDRHADLVRRWTEENRESVREYQAEWYRENKEARQAYNRKWNKENPDKAREYEARRRRLLAEAVQEPYLRADIMDRDGWVCHLCGEDIPRDLSWPDPRSQSLDHVVPLSLGGDDTPANVRAAHLGCNLAKGNRTELGPHRPKA